MGGRFLVNEVPLYTKRRSTTGNFVSGIEARFRALSSLQMVIKTPRNPKPRNSKPRDPKPRNPTPRKPKHRTRDGKLGT